MEWTTELPFNFNGVEGDLKIVYNPLNQKFYQNGVEIKRKGLGFGGLKYKVKTADGGEDVVKVKGALLQGRRVEFRGETINLEENLSNLSFFLSFLPFIFILFILLIFFRGQLGVINGALIGGCSALGMQTIANSLRGAKNLGEQIIYSLIISVAATALFCVLALIIGLILAAMFGAAYAIF